MTVETMRAIDRFLGIPLCWISGITLRRRRHEDPRHVRSVLVMKFFGMGSIVLATATLQALRKRYPQSRIVFLSFAENKELLRLIKEIDQFWLIDPHSVRSFISTFARLMIMLGRTRFDVVIDLEFFSKFSTLIGALARPPVHIGYSLPARWRSWNLSHSIPLRIDRHVVATFQDTLRPLGITPTDSLRPSLKSPGARLPGRLDRIIPSAYHEIICINPNAGRTALDRRWNPRSFARTASILRKEFPESLMCFTGASSEREYVQHIVDKVERGPGDILNLAGVLSLRELMTLFSYASILITNDSGPMHLAAALDVPTVALFGPESPEFYGPIGNVSENLYASLSCSPCLNMFAAKTFRCPIQQECMKAISPETVAMSVRTILKQPVPAYRLTAAAR
jgi:lipopolysaccharide heptosyltransferase II